MDTISFVFQGLIPAFILFTVIYGFAKGVPVYDSFVSGAKDGIGIIIGIFPYVLAIFIAVKTFEASGAHDFLKNMFCHRRFATAHTAGSFFGRRGQAVSNAASLGIFTEILKSSGPDSLGSMMAAVIMGSAETTFYVLAVYLGAVGIKKTKYLVPVCLAADMTGIVIAIILVKLLY